jgi:hypothetical protein
MTHVFVRHRVNDYGTWKAAFDNFVDFRRSSGEKSFQVLQQDKDTNSLYLMFQWDNPENASKFFDSDNLKKTMEKAGVAEKPEIVFLNQSDSGDL